MVEPMAIILTQREVQDGRLWQSTMGPAASRLLVNTLCDSHEALRAALAAAEADRARLREALDAMTEDRDKYRDAMNAEMRLRQDYGSPTIESTESLDKGSPAHRVDNP